MLTHTPISVLMMSAISDGRAMSEVPVSIAAPVFSNSISSFPKVCVNPVLAQLSNDNGIYGTAYEFLKLDLPVSLSANGTVGDLPLIMAFIDTSKGGNSSLTALVGVAEPEGEFGLVK